MSSLATRRSEIAAQPEPVPFGWRDRPEGRICPARAAIWSDLLGARLAGARRILVCGDGAMVAHWIRQAPAGVRVEHVGGARIVPTVDHLLGRDRFGEIGAVLVACDGTRNAAATIAGLRAVIERSYHDATLLADWPGCEDDADFADADVLVAEASDWAAGPAGPVLRDRRRLA